MSPNHMADGFVKCLTADGGYVTREYYRVFIQWMCDNSPTPDEWNENFNNAIGLWSGIVKHMDTFDAEELSSAMSDRASLVQYIHRVYGEDDRRSWYYTHWFSARFPPA